MFVFAQFLPSDSRRFATNLQKSADDRKSTVAAANIAVIPRPGGGHDDTDRGSSRGRESDGTIQNITSEVERLVLQETEQEKSDTNKPSGTSAARAEQVSTSSPQGVGTIGAVGADVMSSRHDQGGGWDQGRRQTDAELEGRAQIVFGIVKDPIAEASVGNDAWLTTTYHSLLAVLQVISK